MKANAYIKDLRDRLHAANERLERLGAEVKQLEETRDWFINELLENADDSWDGDDSAESIAIRYVRYLEDRSARVLTLREGPNGELHVVGEEVSHDTTK